VAHELDAVADAEHGHAKLKDAPVGIGACLEKTELGPPERMMPVTPSAFSWAAGVL
jgi:hypothetical protein